jgi:hypothetical protein
MLQLSAFLDEGNKLVNKHLGKLLRLVWLSVFHRIF